MKLYLVGYVNTKQESVFKLFYTDDPDLIKDQLYDYLDCLTIKLAAYGDEIDDVVVLKAEKAIVASSEVSMFDKLDFQRHSGGFGQQATIFFDNGYGASVIIGEMFYSDGHSTYELAILKGTE